MRLLYITPYFSPAKAYGGPIASAGSLCRALAVLGTTIRVLASDADGPRRVDRGTIWNEIWPGVRVHYSKRLISELWAPGQAWYAVRGLLWADVVYVWGAFFWALPLLAWISFATGRALIVSPRGMLFDEALARKSIKKMLYLALVAPFGHPLFHIHATSQAEAETTRKRWPKAKITVIPNGVDVPNVLPAGDMAASPYMLYLGRLHPYKQVERVIGAFAGALGGEGTAHDRPPTPNIQPWALIIAGDGDPIYRRELERKAAEHGVGKLVQFVGHIESEKKSEVLANAQALVLASKSENFGMSVAEALVHGTPCVVTKTAPWEGLERERCGFWVDDTEEALAEGMRRMMALSPEERRAMGERGRAWMERDYSWESVAKKMIELYEDVIEENRRGKGAVGSR